MRPALANGSRGRPAHLQVPGGRERPPGFPVGFSIERSCSSTTIVGTTDGRTWPPRFTVTALRAAEEG
jgi:hypothetical protein